MKIKQFEPIYIMSYYVVRFIDNKNNEHIKTVLDVDEDSACNTVKIENKNIINIKAHLYNDKLKCPNCNSYHIKLIGENISCCYDCGVDWVVY